MNYWLIKSEPDAFSIDDLKNAPGKKTHWDGIRNYQARNFMRDGMQVGDGILFYHSNTKVPGIVGLATVASPAYPDDTQFDPKSDYHDPKSTRENPRCIIIGMVSTPVERTLTMGPPEMVPNMAEDTIAAWAGPLFSGHW